MNRYELRFKPAPASGKVWVSAVLVVGAQAEMRVDRRMRRTWTLARLRVAIGKTMGWRGFGLSRARQLDETGETVLERTVGPRELVIKPTKTKWELENEDMDGDLAGAGVGVRSGGARRRG